VRDVSGPVVTVPADISLEATDADGETISYTGFSATDAKDGVRSTTCAPASGSVFPVGATTVTCTATDTEGNTGTAGFVVSITDTTAPVLSVPAHVTVEATGPSTAVSFAGPSATDIVDVAGVAVTCSPASGSMLGLGDTAVSCAATDAHGNSATAAFTVSVLDTTAPVVTVADLRVPATSPDGTAVEYSSAASDALGTPTTTCLPLTGSIFAPESSTAVTCSATDLSGNIGTGTFTVTVSGALVSVDAAQGDTEVEVSADIFQAGDYAVISAGRPDQEVRYIAGLGSIILAAPLTRSHPAGSTVSVTTPPLGDVVAPTISAQPATALPIGVPASATVSCTDAGVGVESCDAPVFDTSAAGSRSVTMRAWDFNGNLRTLVIDYTVAAAPSIPTPGGNTPGTPTPGGQTPGSPTQGTPTPGVPTPAVLEPGALSPVAELALPGRDNLAATGVVGFSLTIWLALLLLVAGAGVLGGRRSRRQAPQG